MSSAISVNLDQSENLSSSYGLILSKSTNLRLFQIQNIGRNQFKISENELQLYERAEYCGKRKVSSIFSFSTMFLNNFFPRVMKIKDCLIKGFPLLVFLPVKSMVNFYKAREVTLSLF